MGVIITHPPLQFNNTLTYKINIFASTKSQQLSYLQSPSKKSKKQQKQKFKIKNCILKCIKFINNLQSKSALPLLKELIEKGQHLDDYQFKGIGNEQQWYGYYKQGIIGLLKQNQRELNKIMNPFDLISICFSFQVNNNKEALSESIKWYQNALQQHARYELFLGLAHLYYNNKIYVKAEQNYKRSLELKPFAKTYEYLAWIYGYWFDYDSLAAQYALKSLQLDPQSMTCQYIFAICQRAPQTKLALLQQLLKKHQNYYRVYVNIGQICKDKQQAQDYYYKCLVYDDMYKIAYLKLGDLQRFDENYQQAFSLYMKVKEIDELQDYSYFYLGCLAEDKGQFQQALALYNLCLQINPYNADICATLAAYHKNQGDSAKAIFYMHKQLENNPFDYQNANLLGMYYDEQEEKDKALQFFHKSLQINHQYYQACLNLGSSYQQLKKLQQGIKYYLRASQIDPTKVDPYFGLAICYGENGELDVAIEFCNKCIGLGGDQQKEVYQFLGDLFRKKNDYQMSLHTYILKSILSETLNTEYILHNLIRQIDRNSAIQLLQRQLSSPINSEFFYAEIGKLALEIELQQVSINCFKKLQEMGEDEQLNAAVEDLLQKYKGTSFYIRGNYRFGVRSFSDMVNLISLKKKFEKGFLHFYEG